MKAAVFHGPGKALSIEDVAAPSAGPGQMVLQVRRCGVCGTDLHITAAHGDALPGGVIGHEFCGEIVEIGPGVADRWKVGDRAVSIPFIGCGACAHCLSGRPVWCRSMRDHVSGRISGGFAQFTPIGALGTVKLPAGMDWETAALVEPLSVGLHGLRRARLEPGANVLVVGSGPVGLATALWAKALGARQVIMTARSTRGEAMARALGVDDFIDGALDVRREFRRIAGAPPDAVFECVGAPGLLEECIRYAPIHGQVVVLGGCRTPDTLTPALAMNKELTVTFALCYDLRDFEVTVDRLARGVIDPTPMITDRVDFAAFPDAFEALRARTHQCKVLLSPWAQA
jgi:(R,R)-butanediol dehydrogenase/meso-butanediol dehydrogenase/diacetyl reductase